MNNNFEIRAFMAFDDLFGEDDDECDRTLIRFASIQSLLWEYAWFRRRSGMGWLFDNMPWPLFDRWKDKNGELTTEMYDIAFEHDGISFLKSMDTWRDRYWAEDEKPEGGGE